MSGAQRVRLNLSERGDDAVHYVLSDIHGNERRFNAIMEKIDLQQEDTLYILGDAIDRHPDGIRILRRLMAMPNVRMILGNHEYMMLRALGDPVDSNADDGGALSHWYRNGGEVTHSAWNVLGEQERRRIRDYLHSLPLNIDVEVGGRKYKLVHGAPVEGWAENRDPRYRTATHFAVWRRLEAEEPLGCGETVIFGHTPTHHYKVGMPMGIWYGSGRIGIDCGGGWPEDGSGGRLACLRLEDGAEFYAE